MNVSEERLRESAEQVPGRLWKLESQNAGLLAFFKQARAMAREWCSLSSETTPKNEIDYAASEVLSFVAFGEAVTEAEKYICLEQMFGDVLERNGRGFGTGSVRAVVEEDGRQKQEFEDALAERKRLRTENARLRTELEIDRCDSARSIADRDDLIGGLEKRVGELEAREIVKDLVREVVRPIVDKEISYRRPGVNDAR